MGARRSALLVLALAAAIGVGHATASSTGGSSSSPSSCDASARGAASTSALSPDALLRLAGALSGTRLEGAPDEERLLEELAARPPLFRRRVLFQRLSVVVTERSLPFLEGVVEQEGAQDLMLAAHALGQLGGEQATALLRRLVRHPHGGVRGEAVAALGYAGDVDELAALAIGADLSLAQRACSALVASGDERGLDLVIALLSHKERLRAEAAAAALATTDDERATGALLDALEHDEREGVRRLAVYGLANKAGDDVGAALAAAARDPRLSSDAIYALREREDVPLLLSLARAGSRPTLLTVASALAELDTPASTDALLALARSRQDPELWPHLLATSDARAHDAVLSAARKNPDGAGPLLDAIAYGDERGFAAFAPLVEELAARKDAHLAPRALVALARMRGARALPLLEDALATGNPVLRHHAMTTLAGMDDPRARQPLVELARDKASPNRAAAIHLLAQNGAPLGELADELLEELLAEPTTPIADAALLALDAAGHDDEVAAALEAFLEGDGGASYNAWRFMPFLERAPDPVVERFVESVVEADRPEDRGPLLSALARRSDAARAALVDDALAGSPWALGELRANEPGEARAVAEELLGGGDPTLRATALEVLADTADDDAVSALRRHLDDGDEQVRAAALGSLLRIDSAAARAVLEERGVQGVQGRGDEAPAPL